MASYEGKMDGGIITDIISSVTVMLDSSGGRERGSSLSQSLTNVYG